METLDNTTNGKVPEIKLNDLHAEALGFLENSRSENTRRCYESDWKYFVQWCESYSLCPLPADPETIVYYITFLSKSKKASTIKRKLSSISQRHETKGYIPSPTKLPLVKGVWSGIQRDIGVKEVGKEALWLHELRELIESLPKDKILSVRDRALLIIGWAGALRRTEIVNINVEDLCITEQGLVIELTKSKRDQLKNGERIALPYGKTDLLCPVKSIEDWIKISEIKEGPVFRRIDRHGNILGRLSDQSVRLILKKHCEAVGLVPEKYGAHSLRSGFCSQAAKVGKPEYQIMKQTRHKRSDSLHRYIKKTSLFDDNPADGLGL